jgi:hypothetical protein
MTKRWFTVLFEGPSSLVDLTRAKKNCAGQWVAWDGQCTFIEARAAARRLAEQCQRVQLFMGKEMGRLLATYECGRLAGANMHAKDGDRELASQGHREELESGLAEEIQKRKRLDGALRAVAVNLSLANRQQTLTGYAKLAWEAAEAALSPTAEAWE